MFQFAMTESFFRSVPNVVELSKNVMQTLLCFDVTLMFSCLPREWATFSEVQEDIEAWTAHEIQVRRLALFCDPRDAGHRCATRLMQG